MLTIARSINSGPRSIAVFWLATVAVLGTLLTLLTIAIKNDPEPSLDKTVLDWVTGLEFTGLAGFSRAVSAVTSNYPVLAIAASGVLFLWLLGMNRAALGFAVVGLVAAIVALAGDELLSEYGGARGRSLRTCLQPVSPADMCSGPRSSLGSSRSSHSKWG